MAERGGWGSEGGSQGEDKKDNESVRELERQDMGMRTHTRKEFFHLLYMYID